MTQEQIETILTQLQQQVQLNTTAIQQLSDRFNNYVTLSTYYSTNNTVNANSSAITTLKSQIASLQTSIGLVNKLSKLLDTNITDITKDDLLQWDGDRWTNIKPSKLGITGSSGVSTLEGLSDVKISNKSNGQALIWSNVDGKWINGTISSSGEGGGSSSGEGGGTGLDVNAMWEALATSSSNQIHPSHITGSLTLSGLTVNGSTTLKNSNTQLNVTTSQVTVNGNIVGTGEITAYSV